jgi:transcriptional regulator with XRE-family HTH domain
VDARADLGTFLRRRRERLTPADVGLPEGGRRRAPGLRRDEVAGLAHMSTVYYERIEQGRGSMPSPPVLDGIAGALRLTDAERDHLYRLAGHAAPAPDAEVDPSLVFVLTEVEDTTPAFMTDDLGVVVAQNRLNRVLFGDFTGQNLVRHWFTSPPWRHRLEPSGQHEQTGLAYVADLRAAVAVRGYDSAAAGLVAELRAVSAEFREMWERHAVAALHCSAKVVHDERVGRLDLDCLVLTSALSRQRLLLLKPVPGTPSEQRLRVLSTYSLDVVGA